MKRSYISIIGLNYSGSFVRDEKKICSVHGLEHQGSGSGCAVGTRPVANPWLRSHMVHFWTSHQRHLTSFSLSVGRQQAAVLTEERKLAVDRLARTQEKSDAVWSDSLLVGERVTENRFAGDAPTPHSYEVELFCHLHEFPNRNDSQFFL